MYKNLKNIYAESSKTNIGFLSLFISSNLCISMIRASTLPHVFYAGRTTTAGQDKTHPTSTGSKHLELSASIWTTSPMFYKPIEGYVIENISRLCDMGLKH